MLEDEIQINCSVCLRSRKRERERERKGKDTSCLNLEEFPSFFTPNIFPFLNLVFDMVVVDPALDA